MVGDSELEPPEARLGLAQEYYAHVVRMGDAAAVHTAEQVLEAARRAVAAERGLSDDDRAALDRNIRALRERLAARTEGPQGAVLVRRTAERFAHGEMEVGQLIAATLEVGGTSRPTGRIAAVGRRAVQERSHMQLEALGEEFANELAEVEHLIAGASVDLRSARRRRKERDWDVRPSRSGARRWAFAGSWDVRLGLLVVLAVALGQYEIAHAGFTAAFAQLDASIVALGYVVTVGVMAALVGRLLASSKLRSTAWIVVGALLCAPSILLGELDAETSNAKLAVSIVVAATGLLFVALSATAGYLMTTRDLRRATRRAEIELDELRARERHASMQAQRVSLFRVYVARGETAVAEAQRLDALYVHQILQRADDLSEDAHWEDHPVPLPRWLRDAYRELERVESRSERVGR